MSFAPRSRSGCARVDDDPPRRRRGRRLCSGCWWCPGRSKRRTRPTVLLPRSCPSWTTRARQSSRTSAAAEPASALTEEGQTRVGGDEVDAQEVIDIAKRTVDVVDAEL